LDKLGPLKTEIHLVSAARTAFKWTI